MRYCPLENGLEVWKTDAWIGRKGPNLQEVGGQPASNLYSICSLHIAALTTQSGLLNANRTANCRITSAGYLDLPDTKLNPDIWNLPPPHTHTHTNIKRRATSLKNKDYVTSYDSISAGQEIFCPN